MMKKYNYYQYLLLIGYIYIYYELYTIRVKNELNCNGIISNKILTLSIEIFYLDI